MTMTTTPRQRQEDRDAGLPEQYTTAQSCRIVGIALRGGSGEGSWQPTIEAVQEYYAACYEQYGSWESVAENITPEEINQQCHTGGTATSVIRRAVAWVESGGGPIKKSEARIGLRHILRLCVAWGIEGD